jgi:hypothetical protein
MTRDNKTTGVVAEAKSEAGFNTKIELRFHQAQGTNNTPAFSPQ